MIDSIEEGRKEDGNLSIAGRIIDRLRDLEKTVKNNYGRWAWELLQNAKDSVADFDGRNVSVKITYDENYIEFKHNGAYFTEKDIRGLINQISSKEVDEGEITSKTGRFGTGFITTYLLSKIVNVKGITKAKNGCYYSFDFTLDREGTKKSHLAPKIEKAWEEFQDSTKETPSPIDESKYNTVFNYKLTTDRQREIAKVGIEEFISLLPFVLVFNTKIESVEIINNSANRRIRFENSEKLINGFIVPIIREDGDEIETIYIAKESDDQLAISVLLKKTGEKYEVLPIHTFPKLFCDFPLIGTENFHFPVLVNSFNFHPQTERDGLWLLDSDDGEDKDVKENQNLLERAVSFYDNLLKKLTGGDFTDLFNVATTLEPTVDKRYFDAQWYKLKIQNPLRKIIWDSPIVETEDSSQIKLSNIWFPLKSMTPEVQIELRKYIYDLYPDSVTKESHIENWKDIYWEECHRINYKTIASTIDKIKSISVLAEYLDMSKTKSLTWLNSACEFINQEEGNASVFSTYSIIPNKNGDFCKINSLFDDQINDDKLLEIAKLVGEDWNRILVHGKINFCEFQAKNIKDIADRITEKLRHPKDDPETKKAIVLLCEWFEVKNPDISRNLFAELYRTRAELFMNTVPDKENMYKLMRSGADLSAISKIAETISSNPEFATDITNASQITTIFEEFGIKSIDELKELLRKRNNRGILEKTEITPELLASLGIKSEAELEIALKDKDFAALYSHKSKSNVEMFVYAQRLIDRANKNVLAHLKTLGDYDCNNPEFLAKSVIGGIKKKGEDITIVVRPSDFREVILYYSSEKDTLDYVNGELWIENGKETPRRLTLGEILKNIGINKIPV